MSSKNSVLMLIPAGVELRILPSIISFLKGRKTTIRNSTAFLSAYYADGFALVDNHGGRLIPLTFTRPVPWPIKPSDVHRMSYRHMHSPIF